VIGAGASAADNAAEALEAGALRVAMLMRRTDVPRIHRGMAIASPGMWHGFYRLPPGQRWSIAQHIADRATPPPHDSRLLARATQTSRSLPAVFRRGPKSTATGFGVRLLTSRGVLCFDYLILCTGFTVDWRRRGELASLAVHVLRWRDRFLPHGRDAYEQAEDPFRGDERSF
jgi:cation diffusion facilitator CzcD-associated flavoprotein CzcO